MKLDLELTDLLIYMDKHFQIIDWMACYLNGKKEPVAVFSLN